MLVNACDVSAAQVSLVFANTTPDDILLKEKLDRLASAHPNFKVNLELEDVPFRGMHPVSISSQKFSSWFKCNTPRHLFCCLAYCVMF